MSKAMQQKLVAALKETNEKFPHTTQIINISTKDLAELLDDEADDEHLAKFIAALEESQDELGQMAHHHHSHAGGQMVNTEKMPSIPSPEEIKKNQRDALEHFDKTSEAYLKVAKAYYEDRDDEDVHEALHKAERDMHEAVECVSLVGHPHTPDSLAHVLQEMGIMQNGDQPVH